MELRQPDTDFAWDHIESNRFRLAPEQSFTYDVSGLRVTVGRPFQVYVAARGRNFRSEEAASTAPP